ncbi:MAG: zinc ribbon domain-containing protein [Oscillospiraceae bacterium]|nr:zinc ribbon domain-containing protein [Oscillospiraceae bacterium]
MDEKRIFTLNDSFTFEEIVRVLEQYLSINKHLTTQRFNLENRAILQCVDSDSSWKQFLGLDAALTVELIQTGNNTLVVNIGNAKWLDKVGAAAAGALFFSPLIVAAGIGAVRQAVLPTEIFTFLESKLGSSVQKFQNPFDAAAETIRNVVEPKQNNAVTCPCCGAQVSNSFSFCSKCGTKL